MIRASPSRVSYVYAGGKLLAYYTSAGTDFMLTDWLGTKRAVVGADGQLSSAWCSLPFGNHLQQCGGSGTDPSDIHFTGKERDAETGNDYFGARYYASTMGRFLSPDWSAKVEPVPYAKLGDPQSLNLYDYMLDNPLGGVDADGHNAKCKGTICTTGINNFKRLQSRHQSYQHQPTKDANIPVTVSQVKANNPFGHSTVQVGTDQRVGLVPNSDKQAAEAVAKQTGDLVKYGTPLPDPVAGHIEGNSASTISSTTIYVTSAQAGAMRSYISKAEGSPQSYDAVFHNCTSFSEGVLGAGGIHAPADITPGGLVNDLNK